MSNVRVRFAPSPTGPLHIGGVRTALYNYLFAKKNNGTFILRIEDTDQTRYVPGAEEYIIDSLSWFGFAFDEGPGIGGNFGPYRQSERKDIYKKYADQLIANGQAYYAFDTPDELDAMRAADQNFKYGVETRMNLKNSLSLSPAEVQSLLEKGDHIAVRLYLPEGEAISFDDEIRGHVSFQSNDLDDKVILKGDGMPTYHLANIVDDHLMEITHVIRGEEWLSSTPHHVLMYRYFGWTAPAFAHLPLILKPTGQGKLSKRDGAKFGFPVFPLSWNSEIVEDSFIGFREDGYLPDAVLNFLALLGWNPGTDQEIFNLDQLSESFSLDKIVKSGARFDIDKAKWFNQQYIIHSDNQLLAEMLMPVAVSAGYDVSLPYLTYACGLMKERVHKIDEIVSNAPYLFETPKTFDDDTISKKYKVENGVHIAKIADDVAGLSAASTESVEAAIKDYIKDNTLKMGEIMPMMRIAICGTMQGPDLVQTILLLGTHEAQSRLKNGVSYFDKLVNG